MRILLAFAMALVSPALWAICSTEYEGLAGINEVSDNDNYFEVKMFSSAITAEIYGEWTLEYCTLQKDRGKESIECVGLGTDPGLSLSSSEGGSPWLIVRPGANDPAINLEGIEIRLADAEGNTIDYLSVYDFTQTGEATRFSQLKDEDCSVGSTVDAGKGNQGKLTVRAPDGVGGWDLDSGNSGLPPSPGSSNDSNNTDLAQINIDNPSVERGEVALFSVTLDRVLPLDQTLTLTYETRDGSANQPSDYEAASGVLEFSGQETRKTISVLTGGESEVTAERFSIVLGVPGGVESFGGTFVSQVGVAEILPFDPENNLASVAVAASTEASVCVPLSVSVRALNGSGEEIPDYEGAVYLATSSGRGVWSLGKGAFGQLSGVDGEGGALYRFAPEDNGTAALLLEYRRAERITLSATDMVAGITGLSSPVQFLENVLLIEPVEDDLIAGRPHDFKVTLLRQFENRDCGIAEDYAGTFGLNARIDRTALDPGGKGPTLVAENTVDIAPDVGEGGLLQLSFTKGTGFFELYPSDVGEYSLELKDADSGYLKDSEGNTIPVFSAAAMAPWTVRPFALDVTAPSNPAATDANGEAFVAAGAEFSMAVRAVQYDADDDSDGDGRADITADLSDNPVTVSFGLEGESVSFDTELLAPDPLVSNNPGLDGGSNPMTDFSSGVGTASNFRFSEVGIIQVSSRVSDGIYLGASAERTAKMSVPSSPIGRFTPHIFDVALVDSGTLDSTCVLETNRFTYIGQTFSWLNPPRFEITPKAAGGETTRNYYRGDFMKLDASGFERAWPETDGMATLAGSDEPVSLEVTADIGGLDDRADGDPLFYEYSSADEFVYVKTPALKVGPFAPYLLFQLTEVSDSDGVSWMVDASSVSSKPLDFKPDTLGEIRYGRLELDNVYGPETGDPLLMPFKATYWDGTRFVTNTDDSCSPWATSDITVTDPEGVMAELADLSGELEQGSAAPLELVPTGNRGEAILEWDVPVWLQDDWNQDDTLVNPRATATFGVYRGNDRIIYWREAPTN